MRIIVPGHHYELSNHENKAVQGQTLQFIHKERTNPDATELRLVADGTTNEEVLEMLIDRVQFLNDKMPCEENAVAIKHLGIALASLLSRTAKREVQGIEGTDEAHDSEPGQDKPSDQAPGLVDLNEGLADAGGEPGSAEAGAKVHEQIFDSLQKQDPENDKE